MFYTPFGQLARSLRVPGGAVTAAAWEGGGLRIALAIDSFIYFANIRPKYNWSFFEHTLVYSFTKSERKEHSVMFWDTRNDDKYLKYVSRLMGIYSHGDRCVLAQRNPEEDSGSLQWALIVCNAIGSPIDSKYIDVEPKFVAITGTHIIAASQAYFYAWNYQAEGDSTTRVLLKDQRVGRDVVRHIDDSEDSGQGTQFKKEVTDPIVAIAARKDIVVIARRGGTAYLFQLPAMHQLLKFPIGAYAQILAINCDATKLALVDMQALLLLYELRPVDRETTATPVSPGGRPVTGGALISAAQAQAPPPPPSPADKQDKSPPSRDTLTPMRKGGAAPIKYTGRALPFERRDVWDLVWAQDNPDLLSVMEKTRMYVMRGLSPEENILSSGYLCKFNNLKIKAVMLDEVLRSPEQPDKEAVFYFETMALRDSRAMVSNPQISFEDCCDFVVKHSHPRLWRILAEASLQRLDLPHAEKGFVRCGDYQGILFVKKLMVLDDPAK
jgi:WD repeat-containing protein 35